MRFSRPLFSIAHKLYPGRAQMNRNMKVCQWSLIEQCHLKSSGFSLIFHAFQGLSMKDLKHEYSLVPLFFFMACGTALVVLYSGRLAIRGYDVSWRKQSEPWEDIKDKQYTMLPAKGVDYKSALDWRPNYKD